MNTFLRTFFAINLPEHTQQRIADIISALQKTLAPNAVRWTLPHNLHITLQFIKEIKPEDITPLLEHVKTELREFHAFDLALTQIELFPNLTQPRFISMNMSPQKTLAELAEKIGRGILAVHYPIETRPFRGHLTLGKLNSDVPLTLVTTPVNEKILVNKIILYRSEPTRKRSNYTPLHEIALK